MMSKSKSRRTTPVHKLEEIPIEPTTTAMPESAVKPKKSNAWIAHVKSLAERKGIKFRDALRDPETKATYKK